MRFFVVPGIGQLELNGERSGERMVWSPLKLRPAVILGYYGYPISGRGKDVNGARSGLDWQRMMDRPLPTDYLGPHFGDGAQRQRRRRRFHCRTDDVSFNHRPGPPGPGALLSFVSGANHGIGNQISIPSRFIDHEISPLLAARESSFGLRGPFSDPRADTHMLSSHSGQLLFHCIVLETEG